MRLPTGTLVRSRVESDPTATLAVALDDRLTGYAVLEPHDTLLLDGDDRGVVTFDDGVPVLAYHTGTDRGGPGALAALATPGPYRVELYELDADALESIHDTPELRVPPGMPAQRLAGDPELAERTRALAPDGVRDAASDGARQPGAVEAFLDDTEKLEAIRERAQAEARERAAEWGLSDELETT